MSGRLVWAITASVGSTRTLTYAKNGGKAALTFRVTAIKWLSDTEVEVEGGYSEGNMSASVNTYKVVRKDRKWTVTSDEMNSIS